MEKREKIKVFSQKQIERLPDFGYWVEMSKVNGVLDDDVSVICIMNGSCKYIRTLYNTNSWNTLLWTCVPTRNMVKGEKTGLFETFFEYYKTYDEMINKHPEFTKWIFSKAPNDFEAL